MSNLFNKLQSNVYEEKYNLLLECVSALSSYQSDSVAQIFLFEHILNGIAPKKPEPVIYLNIEKKRSQEDYLKGSLRNNPYIASDIGRKMRDIRTKIYKDLEFSKNFIFLFYFYWLILFIYII